MEIANLKNERNWKTLSWISLIDALYFRPVLKKFIYCKKHKKVEKPLLYVVKFYTIKKTKRMTLLKGNLFQL